MILDTLIVDFNRYCFLKCNHCSAIAVHPIVLSMAEVNRWQVADFIKKFDRVEKVEINGGEPFIRGGCLREYLVNFLDEMCDMKNVGSVSVNTCGIGMDTCHPSWSVKPVLFEKKHSFSVCYVIHSINSEIHDCISGFPGAQRMTMDSLLSAKDVGMVVNAHVVPMRKNLHTIPLTIEWLRGMGVQTVSILKLQNQGRARDVWGEISVSDSDEKNLIDEVSNMDGVRISNSFSKNGCTAGENKLFVSIYGDIYPCVTQRGSVSMGNIKDFDVKSLGEIYK